jgi:hypothetical protein
MVVHHRQHYLEYSHVMQNWETTADGQISPSVTDWLDTSIRVQYVRRYLLKGTIAPEPDFKTFIWPTISNLYFLLRRWRFLNFFHFVVILTFEYKILMYIAPNTAECSLKPLVISFPGFPLAVCSSQAGSL